MIVSHRHRFIFMHCRKAAGTSVTIALGRHLGPLDVQIGAWKDAADAGVRPNLRAWLDAVSGPSERLQFIKEVAKRRRIPPASVVNGLVKRAWARRLGPEPGHATAEAVRSTFPKEWGSYFKFCFIRNPYEQAVSAWKFHQRKAGLEFPFSRYLSAVADGAPSRFAPVHATNWPIYTIGDSIAVDFVGRFETIDIDLPEALSAIGLLHTAEELPHAKRSPPYDYREAYDEQDRKLAARLFEKEIDTFRYAF